MTEAMHQVLVIEDEPGIRAVLRVLLTAEGYRCIEAGTALRAEIEARSHKPDLLLIDLGLPDGDGLKVIRRVREWSTVPIVVLSARAMEQQKVAALDAGADDYIVKPFSVRELLLRVQAVLRRVATEEGGETTQFGMLRIDRGAHRVWVEAQEVELTALEFKLLLTLHDRRNRVQTRDALLSDVWKIDADVTTRTVDTHVKRLREKLGHAGIYVQTVRGVGYRFAERPDEVA
jgi:two-component system phosphate regulon response regulator PhoB